MTERISHLRSRIWENPSQALSQIESSSLQIEVLSPNHPEWKPVVQCIHAECLIELSRYGEAMTILESVRDGELGKLPWLKKWSLTLLSKALMRKGQLRESLDAANEAHLLPLGAESLDLNFPLDRKTILIEALAQKMLVTNQMGLLDEVTSLFHQAEALRIVSQNDYHQGLLLHAMGNVKFRKEMFDEALKFYLEAARHRHKIHDTVGESSSLNNIGYILNTLGDLHRSTEFYGKAYELKKRLGDTRSAASILDSLGRIYTELGLDDAAEESLKCSLKHMDELQSLNGVGDAHHHLATLYHKKKDYEKALFHAKSAEKIRSCTAEDWQSASVYLTIAEIYLDLNDRKIFMEYIKKSGSLCIKFNYSIGLIRYHLLMAQQKEREGKIHDASQQALSAHIHAQKADLKKHQSECLLVLSRLEEKEGRYKEALEHMRNYEELRSRATNQETLNRIISYSFQHRTEQAIGGLKTKLESDAFQERLKGAMELTDKLSSPLIAMDHVLKELESLMPLWEDVSANPGEKEQLDRLLEKLGRIKKRLPLMKQAVVALEDLTSEINSLRDLLQKDHPLSHGKAVS